MITELNYHWQLTTLVWIAVTIVNLNHMWFIVVATDTDQPSADLFCENYQLLFRFVFVFFAMHSCHFHYCKLGMSLCEYTNPFSVEKLPAIARVDLFAGLNVWNPPKILWRKYQFSSTRHWVEVDSDIPSITTQYTFCTYTTGTFCCSFSTQIHKFIKDLLQKT